MSKRGRNKRGKNWWVTARSSSQCIYKGIYSMWTCTVRVFGVRWSTKLAARRPAVWPGHTRQMVSETVGKGMFVYLCVHTVCRIPLIYCAWIVCICLRVQMRVCLCVGCLEVTGSWAAKNKQSGSDRAVIHSHSSAIFPQQTHISQQQVTLDLPPTLLSLSKCHLTIIQSLGWTPNCTG